MAWVYCQHEIAPGVFDFHEYQSALLLKIVRLGRSTAGVQRKDPLGPIRRSEVLKLIQRFVFNEFLCSVSELDSFYVWLRESLESKGKDVQEVEFHVNEVAALIAKARSEFLCLWLSCFYLGKGIVHV